MDGWTLLHQADGMDGNGGLCIHFHPFHPFEKVRGVDRHTVPEELIIHINITDETYDSPNFEIASFKAVIYLSRGPEIRSLFRNLFSDTRIGLVLMAVEPKRPGQRKQPHIHFIVIKQKKGFAYRMGVMVVKADFETFKQNLKFERREIRLR
jgi:hypothetical protein